MADPIAQNILGVQQLVGSSMNKIKAGATGEIEGVDGEKIDEFTLKLSDEELLALKDQLESAYAPYEAKISERQERIKTYYQGLQKQGSPQATDNTPIASNLLFEAEETFLPAALSKNPEPVVYADNTPEGVAVSNSVKTMLQYHADVLALRPKLRMMTRHWSIYLIGVLKHGWDDEIQDIRTDIRDPRNFVFDPTKAVDMYGDYEGMLGERITVTASKLVKLFPKHAEYIRATVDQKMGTNVIYTEWWNEDYCFYTYKRVVLDKQKNPYFNYEKEEPSVMPDGQVEIGLDGMPLMDMVKGKNHFGRPKKPYTFLSVFSLGEQPHDITGLIEQNIPNQNLVSRRTYQIDYNLSRSNNSDVFSATNFTQETAKQAANGLAKGNPILVPDGVAIRDAVVRLEGQSVPDAFFKDLENNKQATRSSFGTEGITSQPANEDTTARGMILNQQFDNTRIGGGIGDSLEQVADNVFNWWVQLYYVFYDEQHFAAVMGKMKSVEYVTLQASDMDRRIVVSVSADSMKPKDEITEMNQAQTLYDKGAIGPKTLLTILNFPDAEGAAEDGVLWAVDKMAYMQINFPDLIQKIQQAQAGALQQGVPGAQAPPAGGEAAPVPQDQPEPLSTEPANAALSNVPLPA